jgi:hypothetical protein
MPIDPTLIHLMLPFTDVPMSGIKSNTSNNMLISINNQSIFSRKLDGIMRKKTIARSPIETNISCLEI